MRTPCRHLMLAAAALFLAVGSATAQRPDDGMPLELRPFLEVRPILGGYVTAGARRAAIHDGGLFGLQIAFEASRRIHLVGSLSYVPTEAGRATDEPNRVDILLYDVGAELNAVLRSRRFWTPKPFVGAGYGWRRYRNLDLDVGKSYPGGYAAVGVEMQTEVIGIRAEVRDYVSRFAGFAGDERTTFRNDVVLGLGIAYHIR